MSPTACFTCFLIPKPFVGHSGIIQENALRCLAALGIPTLVLGDEPGAAEASAAHGARYLPDLPRNEAGTPRVDLAFDLARRSTETSHLCYLNSDILFPKGFGTTVASLLPQAPKALFTGRRWNLEVEGLLAFDDQAWTALEDRRVREGLNPGPAAMDYFIFPRDAFLTMPPFAIGRPGWDNWMVFQAKAEGRWVVDLSPMAAVLHQNHDYGHVPGGEAAVRNGPESLANRAMAGGYFRLLNLKDATHEAVNGRVKRRWWRLSTHVATRWALGLTTRFPWWRDRLRSLKRSLQGRAH